MLAGVTAPACYVRHVLAHDGHQHHVGVHTDGAVTLWDGQAVQRARILGTLCLAPHVVPVVHAFPLPE